jgi:hypothetical protein
VNPSLTRQIDELLNEPGPASELRCESPLLVAARLLWRAPVHEMTSTTVIGTLGHDDLEAFRLLVRGIAEEYGLAAAVKIDADSFVVRFTRQPIGR